MTSRVIDEPRVGSHDGTALTGSVDFGVLSGGPLADATGLIDFAPGSDGP